MLFSHTIYLNIFHFFIFLYFVMIFRVYREITFHCVCLVNPLSFDEIFFFLVNYVTNSVCLSFNVRDSFRHYVFYFFWSQPLPSLSILTTIYRVVYIIRITSFDPICLNCTVLSSPSFILI